MVTQQLKALYEKLPERVRRLFEGKKTGLLVFAGLAGIALIFLSAVLPASQQELQNVTAEQTPEEYAASLETRLQKMVNGIEGVGRCEVMVTVESGIETVYAVEESQNVNETNSYEGDSMKKQTQQQNLQQKYIVVDAGSGKKEALVKTQRQPAIQGVVVVCEGAGSTIVQERVTRAVTTALGIPYTKVCVTKLNPKA